MDMLQYQKEAQNTKSPRFYFNNLSGSDLNIEATKDVDIFHACLGLCTEAGEVMDPFKKSAFYGKPVDFVNLDEEIGDILWYIAIYAEARGTTIPELAARNNAKLKTRYPEKFDSIKAIERNLEAERKVLESTDPYDYPILESDIIEGIKIVKNLWGWFYVDETGRFGNEEPFNTNIEAWKAGKAHAQSLG